MPQPHAPARTGRAVALAMAGAALVVAVVLAPAGAGAASVDPYGDELMRLTNLDRQALGKSSLAIDTTLAAFARDLGWTCPTNGAMTVRGRSADMADRSYFSHAIKGCLTSSGTDMMVTEVMSRALGYAGMRGENIAWNTYGTESATYAYGCAIDGTGCAGTTTTPKTVEVAQRGFMQSSGHRNNILNSYDRFGCGSWLAPNGGGRYFTCVFSLGGPAATPTPSPTPTPTPTATPTPAPTPTADTARPAIARLTGTSVVRAGWGRTLGATVTDDRALRSLSLYVNGVRLRTWSLGGTTATRSLWVSSYRLTTGRHSVRWTVSDSAGNIRTTVFWLYVR